MAPSTHPLQVAVILCYTWLRFHHSLRIWASLLGTYSTRDLVSIKWILYIYIYIYSYRFSYFDNTYQSMEACSVVRNRIVLADVRVTQLCSVLEQEMNIPSWTVQMAFFLTLWSMHMRIYMYIHFRDCFCTIHGIRVLFRYCCASRGSSCGFVLTATGRLALKLHKLFTSYKVPLDYESYFYSGLLST